MMHLRSQDAEAAEKEVTKMTTKFLSEYGKKPNSVANLQGMSMLNKKSNSAKDKEEHDSEPEVVDHMQAFKGPPSFYDDDV